jgi:5-methylcytosine-specific restriction enzyme A
MQLLADVLDNYFPTRAQLNGKAFNIGNIDQKSLLEGLPSLFSSLLTEQGRNGEFKVEGSIGNGNLAKVPWVGVFNKIVTETAQEGYYIVLLFAEDMKSCTLSLNQGVTDIKEMYGQAIAHAKMRSAANRAHQFYTPDPHATLGPIELRATGHLGKGYEQGAIESYRYDQVNLPSQFDFEANFLALLVHYDRLVAIAGRSLQTFVPISEAEFQQAALAKAEPRASEQRKYIPPMSPVPASSMKPFGGKGTYIRNVEVAGYALRKAEYKCEINPEHATFHSRARDRPYVEAHHLVPMSHQAHFTFSLDVPANVVALCATCHRLLHHGRTLDRKAHLLKLLDARLGQLQRMRIAIDRRSLLLLYGKEAFEEE